jgi:hypothetical protein
MRALESYLGEAADVAKVVAIRQRLILRQRDFNGDAARIGIGNSRRQQTVIDPRRRTADPPHLSELPMVASDQTDVSGIAGFDPLKIALRKLNGNKPVGAVCEIEQRLSLGHRRPRTCRYRPDDVRLGQRQIGVRKVIDLFAFLDHFRGEFQ